MNDHESCSTTKHGHTFIETNLTDSSGPAKNVEIYVITVSVSFVYFSEWCDSADGRKHLSRLMGKPTICIGENKGADQLRGNREADQRLCFRYSDSTIPLLLNSKISSCDCIGRFASDLFGNHIVGFPTRRLIWQ